MSQFITAGIGRVSNLQIAQSALSNLQRTNLGLFGVSTQLSTGRAIARPSDDAVAAATIGELDLSLDRGAQRRGNLDIARGNLSVVDSTLGEISALTQEAVSIASTQISLGSSAAERESQANIIDAMLDSLFRLSNEQSISGYIFGGTRPGTQPVQEAGSGFRFVGESGGLTPDLGLGDSVPVTLGASNAVGALSARVSGTADLDPGLTLDTRVSDLRGASGLGVDLGSVEMIIDGTDAVTMDFSDADTVEDIVEKIEQEIGAIEESESKTVLTPAGVTLEGGSIRIEPAAGSTVEFRPVTGDTTAADLGLAKASGPFTTGDALSEDLDPRLTKRTPIAALQGLTSDLGTVIVSNNGNTVEVDLSEAETISDIESALESASLGVRVDVASNGSSLEIVSEVAAGSGRALSISDADDDTQTATALGVRSLQGSTRIADFNFGRGVEVLEDGATPDLNIDFEISIDGGATVVPIDLRSTDLGTVDTVIEAINTQLEDAGVPETQLRAGLVDGQNGIALLQDPALAGEVDVLQRNNSPAGRQLGLLDGTFDDTTGEYVGADRAQARVDNLFSHLIDLRDALRANDRFGIELAAEDIERSADRVVDSRALVGGLMQRVEDETRREEDRMLLDERVRSQLRDTDFASAASELSQLQTQLEASLRTAGVSTQLSLLDFIR